MKIISGNLSGRSIKSPKGRVTRPTSARAKESLFNFLVHGLRFNFDQVHVLDLFAGSGSLGIEALSRGAKFCSFIDNDMNSITTIKDNLRYLGLEKQGFVKKYDAKIVPIYIERIKNNNFKIKIYKSLKFSKEDSLESITLKLNKILEGMIIKNPEQWIWTHSRWK